MILTPLIHPIDSKKLGRTTPERLEAYKALFKTHLDDEGLMEIRDALQTGTPLGNELFKEKIEKKLKSKVGQAKRGRPKKALTP